MRGPRKPISQHRLEGTFNVTRHRSRAVDPEAPGELPAEPPAHLSPYQAVLWRHAVEHAPRGVLRRCDEGALLIWVEAADRHRSAMVAQNEWNAAHSDMSNVVHRANGDLAVSPLLAVMDKAGALLLRAGSELGFSPASRPGLATAEAAATPEPTSPWAALKLMPGGKQDG